MASSKRARNASNVEVGSANDPRLQKKLGASQGRDRSRSSPTALEESVFNQEDGARIEIIRAPWRGPELDDLIHGFSTRKGGRTKVYASKLSRSEASRAEKSHGFDLNLGFTASDDRSVVAENRSRFLQAISKRHSELQLVTAKQIHSALILRVPGKGSGRQATTAPPLACDGLMTDHPGVLLGIQTADCFPILLADLENRAVAAFHAGWRGTLARIVENGVGRMALEFGSKPENLIAAIGPGIGQCCYAVGDEVRQEFESQFPYAAELFQEVYDSDPVKEKYPLLFLTARAPGHSNLGPALHLDLAEANRRQLLAAGLKPQTIHLVGECTCCNPERFFSHRAELGRTGRMMNVIGMNPARNSKRHSF